MAAVAALLASSSGQAASSGYAARAELAYERMEGGKSSIWVARGDGSHPRRIAREGYAPALSPDGRRLTYAMPARDGGIGVVRLVDLLGGESRVIGRVGVDWSANGKRLALVDNHGLSVYDVDSDRRRRLVRARQIALGSFDRDGDSITYAKGNGKVGRAWRSDVFVVGLADGKTMQLTHGGHSDRPTWGGQWIAYRRFRFVSEWSVGSIRAIHADGSGDHLIATGHDNVSRAEQGIEPVQLSANGRHLVACLAFEFGCPPAAFAMPAGRRVRLSYRVNPRTLSAPNAISRDGKLILVSEDPFESKLGYHVYVVPFGPGKTRLLLNGARSPSWVR